MKLIYIGDHFYLESGTIMSSLYTLDGKRFDFGLIQCALSRGESVEIRPATNIEMDFYERELLRIKRGSEKQK